MNLIVRTHAEELRDAYSYGYAAFDSMEDPDDNPYDFKTERDLFEAWLAGYQIAFEDSEAKRDIYWHEGDAEA